MVKLLVVESGLWLTGSTVPVPECNVEMPAV
jgi:hypothetical protein